MTSRLISGHWARIVLVSSLPSEPVPPVIRMDLLFNMGKDEWCISERLRAFYEILLLGKERSCLGLLVIVWMGWKGVNLCMWSVWDAYDAGHLLSWRLHVL